MNGLLLPVKGLTCTSASPQGDPSSTYTSTSPQGDRQTRAHMRKTTRRPTAPRTHPRAHKEIPRLARTCASQQGDPQPHARIPSQARRTAVRVAPLLTSTTTPPCTDTPAHAHSPVSAERSHGLVNWRGEIENTQRNSGRTPRGEYKKAGSEDPA